MTERSKYLTKEWLGNIISVLTVIGTGVGVYINLTERVTASEQKIYYIEDRMEEYKNVPAALARIEEQINATRNDIARLEKQK